MATLTLTPSRFSGSLTAHRETYSTSAGPISMAENLPSADFGFNELRERMAQFTARFDEFIERGRKQVLEERNSFRMSVAEMQETQRTRKAAIVELESKSSAHAQTLSKEAAETEEMKEAIRTLTEQKEDHVARRDQLKVDVASAQALVRQKRDAQVAHHRTLEAQSRHNMPELRFWEQSLGLRIEASGLAVQDQLRFIFACTTGLHDGKDAWFELNMGGAQYHVASTRPPLAKEELDGLVERLNENRNLGSFLKGIRTALLAPSG